MEQSQPPSHILLLGCPHSTSDRQEVQWTKGETAVLLGNRCPTPSGDHTGSEEPSVFPTAAPRGQNP